MPNWKKVIVSGSDAALNSLNVTTSLTASGLIYPTVDGTAGQVLTTNGAGSLSFSSSSISASYAATASYAIFAETASSALNAQDILILVKNQSGAPIAKGVVVRITGSNNASDIPRIVTASYENDNNSANTLGITNQSIANGSEGYVVTEGILKGINTNAFTSGQLIYLGATGSIIGYAPVAPLHAVRLGEVVREQSNNGSIYVRVDNGYELGELHDVVDTTTTSSYGDLLVKSGSVWTNSKQLTGSYGLTGSLTATSFTGSLFGTASWATNALTASYTPSIAGTDNYIPKFNGSSALENSVMYDDGTNIGVSTTTPGAKLHVIGAISGSSFYPSNAGGNYIQGDGAGLVVGGPSYFYSAGSGGSYFEGNVRIRGALNNDTAAYMQINGGTSAQTFINGWLSVGTTSISARIDTNGSIASNSGLTNTSTRPAVSAGTLTNGEIRGYSTTSALADDGFLRVSAGAGTNANTKSYIDLSGFSTVSDMDRNIIIGTSGVERMRIGTNGALRLNSYGSGTFTGTATQKLAVDSSGNVIEIPIGAGPVDGSGTANYITRWVDTDTITTSSIYETGGNIGIGTTSPSGKLSISTTAGNVILDQINADESAFRISTVNHGSNTAPGLSFTYGLFYNTQENASIKFNRGGSTTGGFLTFTTNDGTERMRIDNSGNVGIGTTSPAYKLSVVGKIALNDGGNSVFIGTNAGLSDDATANINVGIGTNALQNNIVGNQNVAVGNNTLVANTNSNNTAVGSNSLQFNTTGFNNTGIGSYALNANIDGVSNTALGPAALLSNTSGSRNIAVGSSAARLNTSGSRNISIGTAALYENVTGSNNVAIGDNAGRYFGSGTSALTNASGSIFLGNNTRANANGSLNEIVIGTDLIGLGSNTVVLGNDNVTTTALKGNVGIGLTNPSYKLDISGSVAQIVSSDTSFTAWYIGNTGVGHAQTYYDGINGDFSGLDYGFVGQNNAGYMEYYVGPSSPAPYHVFSSGNVGIGTTAPASLLSGTEKVLEISNSNVASLYLDSTGTGRRWSMSSISDGTLVFWDLDAVAERMRIDTSGNVGIGTSSPSYKLDVNGTTRSTTFRSDSATNSTGIEISAGTTSGTGAVLRLTKDAANKQVYQTFESDTLYFGVAASQTTLADIGTKSGVSLAINTGYTERMRITDGGNVGIGTTNPSYLLDVNGTARVTTLIETSAAKYKTNIQPLEPQLSKVTQLEPVTFDWLDKPQTKTNIGLIADEVEKIYPEFVSKTEDGEIEGIEYSKLTTVLIQSIKELKEIVDQQQAQINKLLNK